MSKKKRIFIMSHSLELGGAEKSLIGLLDAIDSDMYDVDLFLLRHEGELMEVIPTYINLLPSVSAYTVLARPMKKVLKEGHVLLTGARLIGKIASSIYNKRRHYTDSVVSLEYSHKYTCPFMPKIQPNVEYDLAISFLTPHYFVANKVKAKKKIAWIHTDYTKVQVNVESETKMWNQYDYIVSISDAVTEAFCKTFSTLREKIIKVENILPKSLVLGQAEAFDAAEEMPSKGIRILSIGRYCTAKNFDNVPCICKQLLSLGLDVYWYIIGFGGDEALIRQKIQDFHMEERVILLGKKENPYPYIKACDFYIQPSRYEGQCVTVREAQMLRKPVIITRYATSASQLEDGVDGVIVPMNNEECALGIAKVIQDKELVEKLIGTCQQRDYSNAQEVKKIYELMK